MRKPIIGVIPLWDDEKNSIWMLPGYMDLIRESGGIPIIFPLKADKEDIIKLCDLCDGILLTGGHDVNPLIYSQEKSNRCGISNTERDLLEREVFDYVLEKNLPILGICRGIQLINAFLGGTLYQDLPTEYIVDNGVNHQMKPPYDKPCHKVFVIEHSPLHKITGLTEISVNSYHHQAIKILAPSLEAMAFSEDGLVEAVYMPSENFVLAVQWHPEFNYLREESSRKLMAAFIKGSF
ncbi:MAG: gamma-glutamyl-gamma-aminobutyrate hydrolase family protein [Rikenellaceae bacterium]